MAFPVVEATATSVQASSTSHTISLPASIVSGDLLVALLMLNGANQSATWPAGWTEFVDVASSGNKGAFSAAWRKADGTEGATISVTSANSGQSAHNAYRISGASDPATQPPEIATFSARDTPNPPLLAPTGGAKDYLWIASAGGVSGNALTSAPTSYTSLIDIQNAGAVLASARRNLNATSEDPGTFLPATTDHGVAATIAIHPTSGTIFNKALTAALSFGGAVLALASKTFTSALTFGGIVAKAVSTSKTSALTFGGALSKNSPRSFISGLTFSGTFTAVKMALKSLIGGLTFAGNLLANTQKALTAVLTFAGNFLAGIQKTLTASVSFSGILVAIKLALKSLSGVLTFSGNLLSQAQKSLTAALIFSGNLLANTQKALTAALTFTTTLTKLTATTLTASVSFSGILVPVLLGGQDVRRHIIAAYMGINN